MLIQQQSDGNTVNHWKTFWHWFLPVIFCYTVTVCVFLAVFKDNQHNYCKQIVTKNYLCARWHVLTLLPWTYTSICWLRTIEALLGLRKRAGLTPELIVHPLYKVEPVLGITWELYLHDSSNHDTLSIKLRRSCKPLEQWLGLCGTDSIKDLCCYVFKLMTSWAQLKWPLFTI